RDPPTRHDHDRGHTARMGGPRRRHGHRRGGPLPHRDRQGGDRLRGPHLRYGPPDRRARRRPSRRRRHRRDRRRMNEAPFVWGTDTVRRSRGIPFLVYEPRRTNAADLLEDARRWGGRVHVVQGGRRLTFDELLDLVPKAAAVLGDQGVRPGDRVMLLAFNSIEWVVGFWAVLVAGGVVVLANAWWSEAELQHSLDMVDAALVLADRRSAKLVRTDGPVLDLEGLAAEAAGRAAPAPST